MSDPPPSIPHFPITAALFEGSLVFVAVALGWAVNQPPLKLIAWTPEAVAWGAVASLPLLALLWVSLKVPLASFREIVRVIDELLVPMFKDCRLPELAMISILAGLGEEMLFRGVLQQATAVWIGGRWGVWAGLGIASVLFGLAHPITRLYAILAALIGIYLGGLWLASGNLLVPATTHAVYDFLALIYLIRRGRAAAAADPRD